MIERIVVIVTNLHTTADHNIISILKQCGGDVHPNILQAIEDYTACDEAIPQFATGYYSKLIEDLNIIRCNIEKAELYISEVDIGAGAGGAGAGTHGDSSSDLLGNHGDHHSGEFDTA